MAQNSGTSIDDCLKKLHTSISLLQNPKDCEPRSNGRTAKIPPITNVVQSEKEIIELIKQAKRKNKVVRVEGSGHSYNEAIASKGDIVIRLTGDLRKVTWISESGKRIVRVGGGCNIGVNCLDKDSTVDNSLIHQLQLKDCALPNVGGITHQTIAGFISTGSAGPSLQYRLEEVITKIEFIDGCGKKQVAEKETDLFEAVGVSLGLFGIITYIELEVPSPSFLLKGQQIKKEFKEIEKTVQEILEKNEYAHLLWFPQKYAQFVVKWTAEKSNDNEKKPYVENLSNKAKATEVASVLHMSRWLLDHVPSESTYKVVGDLCEYIMKDSDQTFNDVWSEVLPTYDTAPVETIFQRQFTEMWFPIEKTQEVLGLLKELFEDQQIAGNYGTEIYGAKKAEFWLSHSYDCDVVRINPYWFVFQGGNPEDFFTHFWEKLLDVEGIRFHWAMFLPEPGKTYGRTTFDAKFLHKSYPKLEEWLKKRETMDPHQVFVTEYWRKIFNIQRK